MKIYRGISSVDDSLRGAVLSVGNFDGVHLGHQRILRTAHALSRVSSAAVVAMTFEPHPIAILRPAESPPRLTPWEEKAHQLERVGVDAVIRLDTDWPLLSLSAEDFVRQILVKRIHPSYIVEGPNFGFGRGRAGNVETLQSLASKGGFQVRVVEPYRLAMPDGTHIIVSSTVVRGALATGDVEHAARCLGRPYALVGRVVHGAGAGKKLGFPTINLEVGDQLVPAEGVYAGWVEVAGMRRPAAISIGRRPTLTSGEESPLVIEAFVLDESGDWYAESARLELVERLRGQVRFDSREALTEQIGQDVERVRAMAQVAT
ncbi:MAG TPA: bifunctional riboflavin kinase/FAD synthetase [Phycisphaerae bacterium]|nr:bifunctional riboflavin kinase/FAD synthetase [Phycisphaerae bacterium]